MKKRTLFLGCLLALVLSTAALAADYTDVPADSWARESIDKAAEYGLMNGVGEGRFGLGETISREQFVTILVRMFGWGSVSGEDAAIDIADSWAREFVNTAAANGVIDAGGKFRPRDAITRREMAVMLVRALGLGELAKADADAALPFADVTAQRGYIAIAYEIGMTTGATETTFEPDGTADARAGGRHARACLRKVPRAHDVEARLLRALVLLAARAGQAVRRRQLRLEPHDLFG